MPRYRAIVTVAVLLLCLPMARAGAKVVISELFWSGSDLSTADEWIELTNTGSGTISLSGYTLTKLSKGEEVPMLTLTEGAVIESGSTFLISNYGEEKSRLAINPNFVTSTVSLSNTKLQIKLYESSGAPRGATEAEWGGTLLDIVDDGVGAPFAGSNDLPKASMERISLTESGTLKTNWQTAYTFLNFDDGAPLLGTPGAPNGTGPSTDTFAPVEATNFAVELQSSTQLLQVAWTPSTSLDLASQELLWSGTGRTLSKTATGLTLADTGTGITFTLKSNDSNGNTSSGITTISVIRPQVMITEVLANPEGKDDEEWIEIANLGKEAVDLFGWILDEGNSPGNYEINSSLVLEPGDHRAFPKSLTNLPLGNDGEMLALMRGQNVMDTWEYPKTAEEVSYGRKIDDPSQFTTFCVGTPGKPNKVIEPNPMIIIQSGNLEAEGKVTVNLNVEVMTGSTAHATCAWNYGDGFTSDSCNPPSHTFKNPGSYEIKLNYTDFCNNSIERAVTATVKQAGRHQPAPSSASFTLSEVEASASSASSSKNFKSNAPCRPTHFGGVRISEFLPNPAGSDTDGEWIELENVLNQNVSLCGWKIDDAEGGSKPFGLDDFRIAAKQFLVLNRDDTKIALNNSDESVRLFAPGDDLKDETFYAKSSEGESIALRSDGLFVSTPFLTPGIKNKFRTAERRFDHETVVVSAALPNPEGEDKGNEWIEVTNVGDSVVDLRGWFLDNKEDNRSPYEIPNVLLRSGEVRRFIYDETKITLTNSSDKARLLDPDGALVSVLGWNEAASGRIYRPSQPGKKVKARVTNVIDGDTIDVVIDGVRERVRMIGVDTPETVHPTKAVEHFGKEASGFTKKTLEGQEITLEFGDEERGKYGRILAYVLLHDGTNFNGKLIAYGYAYAYLRFPFALSELFAAYEEEAKRSKLGLWADEEVVTVLREEGFISDDNDDAVEMPDPSEDGEGVSSEELAAETSTGATLSGSIVLTGSGTSIPDVQSEELAANSLSSTISKPIPLFSEILPNPPKEGHLHDLGEYIELHNPTDELISLAGLVLDDDPEGSSKPKTLSDDYVIEPHGYLLLCNGTGCDLPLKVTLNNDGEEISLTTPDGTVIDRVEYPKTKRGEVFSVHTKRGWLLSAVATPREENVFRSVTATVDKVEKGQGQGPGQKKNPVPVPVPVPTLADYIKTRYRHIYHQILTSSDEQTDLPPMLAALQSKFVDPSLPTKLVVTGGESESPLTSTEIPILAALSLFMLGGTVFSKRKILLCHPE